MLLAYFYQRKILTLEEEGYNNERLVCSFHSECKHSVVLYALLPPCVEALLVLAAGAWSAFGTTLL